MLGHYVTKCFVSFFGTFSFKMRWKYEKFNVVVHLLSFLVVYPYYLAKQNVTNSLDLVVHTNYGRPMKPFFIEIPNFREENWANIFWCIQVIFGHTKVKVRTKMWCLRFSKNATKLLLSL